MIQLHITMIPTTTKYGKFRKREWAKSTKIPFEPFSEGYYAMLWEGFEQDTGCIVKGFRAVMNCCLYKEAERLEDELRKSKIILTKIEATKNI
nr:MAG TPA: hypothetical protein [Microviridae sp.]